MPAEGGQSPPNAVGASDLYSTATDLGVRGSTPLGRANPFNRLRPPSAGGTGNRKHIGSTDGRAGAQSGPLAPYPELPLPPISSRAREAPLAPPLPYPIAPHNPLGSAPRAGSPGPAPISGSLGVPEPGAGGSPHRGLGSHNRRRVPGLQKCPTDENEISRLKVIPLAVCEPGRRLRHKPQHSQRLTGRKPLRCPCEKAGKTPKKCPE